MGRAAALEDREQIREILNDADMVFIAAGMGGGTGTGAAPIMAEVAREMGVLTVAVVNRPFPFEQQKRIAVAEKGIADLAQHVDSLIIVPNAKLLEVLPADTTIIKAFEAANDVLHDAVKGISDIITRPGHINVDFADVKTVMSKRGMAMMGTGIASRDDSNPGAAAARAAISSPLLENVDISSAGGILMNVSGGEHLTLSDLTAVGEVTREVCDLDDDMLISGMVVNPELGDKVQVTLVATGLRGQPFQAREPGADAGEPAPRAEPGREAPRPGRRALAQGTVARGMRSYAREQDRNAPPGRDVRDKAAAESAPIDWAGQKLKKAADTAKESPPDRDYLDIPAFLRMNLD